MLTPLRFGRALAVVFTCSLACFSNPFTSAASEKIIRASESGDTNGNYALAMLRLAISKVGGYQLELNASENYNPVRFQEEVNNGAIDVMWTASGATIEEKMLPIRIPLYKGLLGFRVFLIHKDDQAKFNHVDHIDDLRKLSLGQGLGWTDTEILKANGMNVVEANKYISLFYMTDGRRFDAFPRGVHEPHSEIARHPDLELAVEDNLMLVYRMPFYLFVSKNRPKLAKDITAGLNAAIEDGSFDALFYSSPTVQDVVSKIKVSSRKVFYLNNPTLPKLTPLDRKELWADPQSL